MNTLGGAGAECHGGGEVPMMGDLSQSVLMTVLKAEL